MGILHNFVSIVPDGADATQIQPQRDWNAVHVIEAGTVTDTEVAAANKDGAAGTASMRTLGSGAAQACGGTDSRLSDARTPTAHVHAEADVTGLTVDLALKAPLASPSLTGVPAAPTAAANTNTTQIATTAFVQDAIAALINSSPASLDTLKELADALGDDANFATTMTTALALKAPLASPTFTGTPAAPTAGAGTNTTQIATTAFVAASFAPLASPTFTGTPAAPTAAQANNSTQIATTAYVDTGLGTKMSVTAPIRGWCAPPRNNGIVGTRGLSSGTDYAVWLGHAPFNFTRIDVMYRITSGATSITWGELALATGAFGAGSNPSLTPVGYVDISGKLGAAVQSASITGLSVAAGTGVYLILGFVVTGSSATIRTSTAVDDLQAGYISTKTGSYRLSTNLNTPVTFTIGATTDASPWFDHNFVP